MVKVANKYFVAFRLFMLLKTLGIVMQLARRQ